MLRFRRRIGSTLKLEFGAEAAVVDQAVAREEVAARSSGAEASSSVGWSCDEVAAAVEDVVSRFSLTNGKEPERPYLGRQMSMRDQAAAAGRPAAPAAAAVPLLSPRPAPPSSLPPLSAPAPAPALDLAPAPAAPVYFKDAALPLVSKFYGGLTVDVAQSISWLDEIIKSLMGANEVVPSDAVTPADSYNARGWSSLRKRVQVFWRSV